MRLPGRLIRGSVRPDRGSLARFVSMRWAALPIVDRRWTAPMSAIALGFGLFVGVAIGPGAEGSFGTESPMVIRVPLPQETQTAQAPPADDGVPDKPASPPATDGTGGPTGDLPSTPPPPVFDTPSPPPVTTAPPITPAPTTTTTTTTTTTDTDDTTTTDTETTTALAGTVVHVNTHAASYAIATDDGALKAVHSHKPPAVGKRVEVEAKTLANGTYKEAGNPKVRGNRGRVTFDGTVSFRDNVTGAYTVSAPGVSMLVRGGTQRTPPRVGEVVEVTARIADNPEPLPVSSPGEEGCGQPPKPPKPPATALEQTDLTTTQDEPAATVTIEAIVQGVCRGDRKLIVSADDLRESGRDVGLAIPDEIRVAKLKPGQVLKLTADIGDSGAFTVTAVAGDEGTHGAEDPDLVQPASGAGVKDDGGSGR